MRRCTVIVLTFLLCLLCACSVEGKKEISCNYSAPLEFSSVEELTDYLSSKEAQEGQNMLSFNSSPVKSIEIPNESAFASAFDAELAEATISGNYVNYIFSVNDVDVKALAENYGFDSISSLNTVDMDDAMDETDASNEQIMMEEFASFLQRITVTCNVKSENSASLINFASGNPVECWEEHPGFYYTRAPYIDMDEPYGYMIYWEDFDNFFSAYVPAHLVNSFFDNYTSLIETVTIGHSSNLETE